MRYVFSPTVWVFAGWNLFMIVVDGPWWLWLVGAWMALMTWLMSGGRHPAPEPLVYRPLPDQEYEALLFGHRLQQASVDDLGRAAHELRHRSRRR